MRRIGTSASVVCTALLVLSCSKQGGKTAASRGLADFECGERQVEYMVAGVFGAEEAGIIVQCDGEDPRMLKWWLEGDERTESTHPHCPPVRRALGRGRFHRLATPRPPSVNNDRSNGPAFPIAALLISSFAPAKSSFAPCTRKIRTHHPRSFFSLDGLDEDCNNTAADSDEPVYVIDVADHSLSNSVNCQGKTLPFPYDRIVNELNLRAAGFGDKDGAAR
ncbi:MAG: hypothetical protein GY811_17145 [Myxococcales bacterium]|nr:hypothetical protein [Myxococcales bacterium]